MTMNIKRLIAAASLGALAVVFSSTQTFAQTQEPKDNKEAGKIVYTKNCVPCHGEKGDGKGPAAVALNPKPTNFTKMADTTSTVYLYDAITKGKGPMPSFEKILNESERKALSEYIKNNFIPKPKKEEKGKE